MKYDVEFFINKFEAIPEDKWCTHRFGDGEGRHCALGHCEGEGWAITEETSALIGISNKYSIPIFGDLCTIAAINDGCLDNTGTPKQRVVNFLKQVKQLQEEDLAVSAAQEIVNTAEIPLEYA